VLAALRGANFSGCYRSSLKASGVRAVGQGTLTLSFDENGRIGGAVFRPSFALGRDAVQCIQSAATSVAISKANVDAAGTADVLLDFKSP
jgi:hypothetical protein